MGFWDFPARGRGKHARAILEALRKEQQAGEQKPAEKEGHVNRQYPTDSFPGPAAWIGGDWKLLASSSKGKAINLRLYDLSNDPAEKNNLAEKHPEKVKTMRTELMKWQESVINSLNGKDYK